MKINVMPSDIKEVKIQVTKAGGLKVHRVTIPITVVRRYDLKQGDKIIIAYLCREHEDIRETADVP